MRAWYGCHIYSSALVSKVHIFGPIPADRVRENTG